MLDEFLRKTEQGSVPATPSVEDILKSLNIPAGWKGLQNSAAHPVEEGAKKEREQLQRDYQATFETPHGRRVLESLLDQTFRRPSVPTAINDVPLSIEKVALYAVERQGQNSVVFFILNLIEKGRKLGTPSSRKKKKKK
ncbi:MAG: hypothetical protein KAJ34_05400 [Thermodesulfovibrionia bacterium]|nr:hypothetical protein [Thermodesulfovibrionia bacterium]